MVRLIILIVSVLIFGACRQYEKIKLEKIIFHSTRCFGSCPAYHAQIDSTRTLLLYSEYVDKTPDINTDLNNPDTTEMGYFTGQVSDRQYNELVAELENVGPDNLDFDGRDCCDGSTKTIIIYYNGKRKFLKSMFPPREADKLISVLRQICESTVTQRTNQTFDIEGSE